MNFVKITAVSALLCAAAVSISGCGCSYGVHDSDGSSKASNSTPMPTDYADLSTLVNGDALDTIIPIDIALSNGAVIKAYLFPNNAPETVNTFVSLAESGYYNGTVVYTDSDNLVYFGKYGSDLTAKSSGISLTGEFKENNFGNNLMFLGGIMGMNHDDADYNSADGEFFITVAADFTLDSKYASFGSVDPDSIEVLQGIMDSDSTAVDGIGSVVDVTITSIEVGEATANE